MKPSVSRPPPLQNQSSQVSRLRKRAKNIMYLAVISDDESYTVNSYSVRRSL